MQYQARLVGCELFLLPVETRTPLKFGAEVLSRVLCARVRVTVRGALGMTATGWGETPLSVQWAWPSDLSHAEREQKMIACCEQLAQQYASFTVAGHALEIGVAFLNSQLSEVSKSCGVPYLAALVCASPFDIALHDAYGQLLGADVYQTYKPPFLESDLATLFADDDAQQPFAGKYPDSFLKQQRHNRLPAWHLVGGLDPLDQNDLTGNEPHDEHPVLLGDWIKRDGLQCLKVKLRGTDLKWDIERMVRVGEISRPLGVRWLSADFNCLAPNTTYVDEALRLLEMDYPQVYDMLMYVEQPFPYELNEHSPRVHELAERRPLLLDESAHDWHMVKLGRQLGWSGVALKTCKTQSGALLSLCWAKAHGMHLMVQDLTNPMLAMIPHALLAAHVDTLLGIETNSMQFYPDASIPEQQVHPGLYVRREGQIDLSTIQGPGFGYRVDEVRRVLPPAHITCGDAPD